MGRILSTVTGIKHVTLCLVLFRLSSLLHGSSPSTSSGDMGTIAFASQHGWGIYFEFFRDETCAIREYIAFTPAVQPCFVPQLEYEPATAF